MLKIYIYIIGEKFKTGKLRLLHITYRIVKCLNFCGKREIHFSIRGSRLFILRNLQLIILLKKKKKIFYAGKTKISIHLSSDKKFQILKYRHICILYIHYTLIKNVKHNYHIYIKINERKLQSNKIVKQTTTIKNYYKTRVVLLIKKCLLINYQINTNLL